MFSRIKQNQSIMKQALVTLLFFYLIIPSAFSQNDSNTLFVVNDAHVRGGSYSDDNFGSSVEMEIKEGSSSSFQRNTYLQFDLDDFTSVTSARLLVYGYAQTTMSIGAYESTTTNWIENTISWNNRPTKEALIATSLITRTPSWVELDITALAQDRTGRLLTVILGDNEAISKTIFLTSKEENSGEFQARLIVEGQPSTVKTKDVYLVIGQSNAAGRGEIEEQDRGELEGVFLLNDLEAWEPATNPMNAYSTIRKGLELQELGFAYSFAEKMYATTGNEIGMVVNARGGTSIFSWREGDEEAYFEEAYQRLLVALSLPNTTFKGILWHQGENNRNSGSYLSTLENLINQWRDKLNMPDLPFIAGQLSQLRDINETFNANILTLPTLVANTAVATTEGLNAPDLTHFDSEGQRTLGVRYADAFLELINFTNTTDENLVHITKRNATGFAFDGGTGGTNGQDVTLSSANTSDEGQLWTEIDRGNGYYSYEKYGTNYSLDGDGGGANNQSVYLWETDDTNQNQQWQKVAVGDGGYKLIKRNATGFAINGGSGGVEGRDINLYDSGNPSQNLQWYITSIVTAEDIRLEAEDYDSMSGIQTEASSESGDNVGWINDGDWIRFDDVNLSGISNMDARIACNFTGGTVEVRTGSATGTLIGSFSVSNTGGNQNWSTLNTSISNASETQDVYLVFKGGSGYLFNVNWIEFNNSSTSNKNVASAEIPEVVIYPNPVVSITTIQGAANATVVVYDINSNVLLTRTVLEDEGELDLSALSTGVYYAQVKGAQNISVIKIVKQ